MEDGGSRSSLGERAIVRECLLLLDSLHHCATIFSAKNLKISSDRTGLTRSAVFLIFFIVVHAVGNLHVFKVSVGNLFV